MGNTDNQDVKIALEEMRSTMTQILQAGDALDQKINNTLSLGGLIMVLTSTLHISLDSTKSDLYWGILLLAVVLYIGAVVIALKGMNPQRYRMAIAAEWDELDKQLFDKDERQVILVLLASYVEQINHNEEINQRKAKHFRVGIGLFAIIILLLLVLVPVSVFGS